MSIGSYTTVCIHRVQSMTRVYCILQVALIDSLESVDKEKFLILGRTWSTVLSDGSTVTIKVDERGSPLDVAYDDRLEYCNQVRKIRTSEADDQVICN